jgi:hypothetical protein
MSAIAAKGEMTAPAITIIAIKRMHIVISSSSCSGFFPQLNWRLEIPLLHQQSLTSVSRPKQSVCDAEIYITPECNRRSQLSECANERSVLAIAALY